MRRLLILGAVSLAAMSIGTPALADPDDYDGGYESPHDADHDRLDRRHDDEHDYLDDVHREAHDEGLTRWEHRRLHRNLDREHAREHRQLNRVHRREHRRNSWDPWYYGYDDYYGYRPYYRSGSGYRFYFGF